MNKEEVKELVSKFVVEDEVSVTWEKELEGGEFLSINGGDPGITLRDDGVYFFEGEDEFEKVPYENKERIEELMEQALDTIGYEECEDRPYLSIYITSSDLEKLKALKEKLKPIIKEASGDEDGLYCTLSIGEDFDSEETETIE